ncbi:MAG: DNA phosphorothioation system sulfurtransferase DndC [Deltaproteobacteria bacterium]|nr:DNA phosphorothioation system sulfurtransferase DndC [Deltaproteobacteria bacterium]
MNKKIEHIENEILDQYLHDKNKSRPWIIGFSGGKDSTVVLQLVWRAVLKVEKNKRKRDIHVVCNNTLVENPIIESYVDGVLLKIQEEAARQGLPIFVYKSMPALEDTFWIKLIGLGYPAPNHQFRWCTERLKIKPTTRYIKSILKKREGAILILGTRISESSSRAKIIKKHNVIGNRLSAHTLLKNAYIFLPIKNLDLEEVWYCIASMESPWGANNETLSDIYADASADDYECPSPLIINGKTPSCGQSRFGCWTCTVVKEDKSTTELIKSGYKWLRPLLDIRNSLVEERNKPENRKNHRRNGAYLENGGPYEPEYRAKVLEQVLKAQKEIQKKQPYVELISHQELVAIQVKWYEDKFYNIKVANIYKKIFQKRINMKSIEDKIKKEKELLKKTLNNQEHFGLIEDLLKIQKTKDLMLRKIGLHKGIETRIKAFVKAEKNED